MNRYIDADALKRALVQARVHIAIVMSVVDRQPAADVVEVRHGRWELCGTFDDFLECSVCRSEKYPMTQVLNHKYCPDCGAKMDGERNENGT